MDNPHAEALAKLQRWQIATIAALLSVDHTRYRARAKLLLRIYLHCSLQTATEIADLIVQTDQPAISPSLALAYADAMYESNRLCLQIRRETNDFESYRIQEARTYDANT